MISKQIADLKREVRELKLQLEESNRIQRIIGKLVGDRGQYRDLVEAVEMKLYLLKNNPYEK